MKPIATVLVSIGIVGLFWLDREPRGRTSKALWISVVYLLINSSRPIAAWFAGGPQPIAADGIYSDPVGAVIDVLLMALALVALIPRRKKVGALLRNSWPILLFFSYAGLSVLWSDFPYITVKHWLKGIEDIVLVLVVVTDGDPVLAVKRLLTRSGFILIPLSLLLSMYYPSLGRVFDKAWEVEYVGVADQKNQLGIICMIFGLASLWSILRALRNRVISVRIRQLVAHGVILGMTIWLLTMCRSLTSSICLVLAGTMMVLTSRRSSGVKPARAHLLVAVAGCSALIPIFFARGLFDLFGRDVTLSGRTAIWHSVLSLVQHPWLGAGYETFLMGPRLVELRKLYQNSFQEAHNGYLEVYLNLGWIGVSLFAFLLITGYQKVVAALRRQPAVGSLSLALLIAVAINGLTEAPFRMMTITIFFLLWSIMASSTVVRPKPQRRRKRTAELEEIDFHSAVAVEVG